MKKKKKNNTNKYQTLLIGFSIIVLVGIALISMLSKGMANTGCSKSEFLSVNAIKVDEEEFKMFLQDEKALTADYFFKQYGAEYDENFWNTQYGEEIPLALAKEKALEKIVKMKVEQQLAIEHGVLKSALFTDIQEEMKKEKSIYGVETLDLFQQYILYHSKIVLNTKEKFKLEADAVPEEQLLATYETDKLAKFKLPDEIKIMQMIITDLKEEKKADILNGIKQDINQGITIEDLEKKYSKQCEFITREKMYGSHEGKDENTSELEGMLKEQAYRLDTHQISEFIQYKNENYIIFCLERKAGEIRSFEEAKISIEDFIKEDYFTQKVEENVKEAQISINEKVYNQIEME